MFTLVYGHSLKEEENFSSSHI